MISLDEEYYVPEAQSILEHGTEQSFVAHPPVGKYFIAAGIRLFGDTPFGWRVGSALFGTAGVLLLYLLAYRLWRSKIVAALAAGLLAVDGLWFVQSRVAMLDIYAATFVLLGVWLLVEDHARASSGARRWLLYASGMAFGLALGSKWSTLPLLAGAGSIALVWEIGTVRARAQTAIEAARRFPAIMAAFVILPAGIYVAAYAPWFVSSDRYVPSECREETSRVSTWVCYQRAMYTQHRDVDKIQPGMALSDPHEYASHAWSWPWIGRPVHHWQGGGTAEGSIDETKVVADIAGLPNPAIWWPAFFGAIPVLGWRAARRDDTTARLLLALIGAGYLPFLTLGGVRYGFLFYMTPMVPFLVLAVTHVIVTIERSRGSSTLGRDYLIGCAIVFAFFYPVLAAVPITEEGAFGWKAHMWLGFDCASSGVKSFCWR